MKLLVGHALTISGTFSGLVLLYFAAYVLNIARFTLILMAFFVLWYFPHTLSHYLIGKLLGVEFSHYFVGRTGLRRLIKFIDKIPIPVLGIKIERNSFGKVVTWRKRTMFLSGVFASMFLPILCLMVSQSYPYDLVMKLIVFGNIVFTFPTSYFVGDIWKARRAKD